MRNNIADIALMAEFIENLCEENQLPMDATFNLNLAIEEAVSNVMKYAYPSNEEHEILLTVNKENNNIIFEKLEYISSSGLRVVIATHKQMTACAGRLVVRRLNREVKSVFDLTGFSNILNIED